jgi:hypothetical protein
MPQHPTTVSPQSAETRSAPVNPCARKVAALRAAFLDAVSEQDVREMTYLIVFNAKAGSLDWLKFLFRYAIGAPRHAVDPDTLNVQEFKAMQEAVVSAEVVEKVCKTPPLNVTLEVCRQAQAAREAEYRAAIPEPAVAPAASSAPDERPRKGRHKAAAPSTNGRDGIWADPWAGFAPSTDGNDGDGAFQTFLERLREQLDLRGGRYRA